MKLAIGRSGAGRPPGLRPLLAAALATVAMPGGSGGATTRRAAVRAGLAARLARLRLHQNVLDARRRARARRQRAERCQRRLPGAPHASRLAAGGRRALTPPNGTPLVAAGVAEISDDGSRVLVSAVRTAAAGSQDMLIDRLAINEPDGSWTVVGGGIRYVDGNGDLSRPRRPRPLERLRRERALPRRARPRDRRLPVAGRRQRRRRRDRDRRRRSRGLMTCGAQAPDDRGNRALEQTGVAPDARTVVLSSLPACSRPRRRPAAAEPPLCLARRGDDRHLGTRRRSLTATLASSAHSTDVGAVFFTTDLALDPADANGADDLYRWDAATGERTRLDRRRHRRRRAADARDRRRRRRPRLVRDDRRRQRGVALDHRPRRASRELIAAATEPAYPLLRRLRPPQRRPRRQQRRLPGADDAPTARRSSSRRARRSTAWAAARPAPATTPASSSARPPTASVDRLSCPDDGAPAERVAGGEALRRPDDARPGRLRRRPLDRLPERLARSSPDDANDEPDVYLWHDGVRSLLSGGNRGPESRPRQRRPPRRRAVQELREAAAVDRRRPPEGLRRARRRRPAGAIRSAPDLQRRRLSAAACPARP